MDLEAARRSLLGTATGDSLGLPFEGLSKSRIAKWNPLPLRQRLLAGRGVLSDDTLQSTFVMLAVLRHPNDPTAAADEFSRLLRNWFLCLPPGIGLSTAKSCLKLCVRAKNRGVPSAGNGAAMRAAVLGHLTSEANRDAFVEAITRVTHTHPLAIEGAKIVAYAATTTPSGFDQGRFPTWDFNAPWPERGPSGYALHTVNAALAAWRQHPTDLESALAMAITMGGDTDSVAAIVGGLVGGSAVRDELVRWVGWPSPAEILAIEGTTRVPWARIAATHVGSLPIILGHGFRRMLPPF